MGPRELLLIVVVGSIGGVSIVEAAWYITRLEIGGFDKFFRIAGLEADGPMSVVLFTYNVLVQILGVVLIGLLLAHSAGWISLL